MMAMVISKSILFEGQEQDPLRSARVGLAWSIDSWTTQHPAPSMKSDNTSLPHIVMGAVSEGCSSRTRNAIRCYAIRLVVLLFPRRDDQRHDSRRHDVYLLRLHNAG